MQCAGSVFTVWMLEPIVPNIETYELWEEEYSGRFTHWCGELWKKRLNKTKEECGHNDEKTQKVIDWLSRNVVEAPKVTLSATAALQNWPELISLLRQYVFDDEDYKQAMQGDHKDAIATWAGLGDHFYYWMEFPRNGHAIKGNYCASLVGELLMDWGLASELQLISMLMEAQKFKQQYKNVLIDQQTLIDGLLREPITDVTLEGWNGIALKNAIEKGEVRETDKYFTETGGIVKQKCVLTGMSKILVDMLYNFALTIVEFICEALEEPEVFKERYFTVRLSVTNKMWKAICDEQAEDFCQAKMEQCRDLIHRKREEGDIFLKKMFALKLPKQPKYYSDPTGVSAMNTHLVQILKTLEELRLTAVAAKKKPDQISEVHMVTLKRFAAESFEWLSPDTSTIKQLEMNPFREEEFCKFYAEQLEDQDCFLSDGRPPSDVKGAYLYIYICAYTYVYIYIYMNVGPGKSFGGLYQKSAPLILIETDRPAWGVHWGLLGVPKLRLGLFMSQGTWFLLQELGSYMDFINL